MGVNSGFGIMELSIHHTHKDYQTEHFLWEVLWKPLGLPKDVRQQFDFGDSGNEIVLMAKMENTNVGVLFAYQISKNEFEIRHIAVKKGYQKAGVGTRLVRELEKIVKAKGIKTIRTISRNTTETFFVSKGFKRIEAYPDHPAFIKHGISFALMRKRLAGENA